MNTRTLGIDLGTNSIGWAIVNESNGLYKLQDAGSLIFQEGVAREKGIEEPSVKKRTQARASRRHYFRRRLRKIELLKILLVNDMCPKLSPEDLDLWRYKKEYPMDTDFLNWQKTKSTNPYYARKEALSRVFDLSNREERYLLGRALYHLAQRRGFLSNRKDQSKESEGTVKKEIDEISSKMKENNCTYLGELFYHLYQKNGKIRSTHTDRLEHSEKEFYAICKKQNLNESLISELHKAIFYQRPLKSQKGTIGKCTFEHSKSRCAVSHPLFEEFRMLAFINNIKVMTTKDDTYRSLTEEERKQIYPLFFRKSKDCFDFEDIAKKIAGKGNYSFREDKIDTGYKFNFRMVTQVSGCPTTTGLKSVFGEDWITNACSLYKLAERKDKINIINDIWHALYSFESNEMLLNWVKTNLQLNEEEANAFTKIKVAQGFASLSLKAIKKILPFLHRGMRYDEAVFVANLDKVLPQSIITDNSEKQRIINEVVDLISNYNEYPLRKEYTKIQAVRRLLEDVPGIELRKLDYIYNPTNINVYPEAEIDEKGNLKLGSPRTSSIRNPMAMRALFKLRHLINTLLSEGKIDRTTRINIEFARELNDANKRKAIERYQRENEKKHDEYQNKIKILYKEACGADILPTKTDILKYQLWEEQDHRCLYTGEQISITDFIGANPKYDIEHTIPRSLGGDDSQENKTLCNLKYNRQIKKATLPSKLSDYPLIMERINTLGWQNKIDELSNRIARIKPSSATTKENKDSLIQTRHYLKIQLKYWQEKLSRFTMTEVPDGFSNRQGVDIGIITKYAREYLKTVFRSEERQIFTVKGMTTAEFRKMWGLQEEYTKKERVNHTHHAIDAIVIACIGRAQYQRWAEYLSDAESYKFDGGLKPVFEKPWAAFTEDVKKVAEKILVVHDTADNTLKQSRKILRKRGQKQTNDIGEFKYQQGDTVRATLHKETFYGAIEHNGEIKYVIRVPLSSLSEKDIDKIVDPVVKEKIKEAIAERGFKHLFDTPIWMNEDKGVEIKKVRVFTSVKQPLKLKRHRDLSKHPYKQSYHVVNDSNYCLAIYEGTNNKGKLTRSFKILNNLEAIKRTKSGEGLITLSDSDDRPLKWLLKIGTMVLLYEKSAKEVQNCTQEELSRRLYKVTGINTNPTGKGYGSIILRYHQEARPSTDSTAKSKNGAWHKGEEVRPGIIMLHTQFNALVEGQDFTISESGEIKFNHTLL